MGKGCVCLDFLAVSLPRPAKRAILQMPMHGVAVLRRTIKTLVRKSMSYFYWIKLSMGACVTQNPARQEEPTDKHDSLLRPELDVDDLPSKLISRKKDIKANSQIRSEVSIKQNMNTLEDRLDEEELQLQTWKRQHNTTSTIILKRPRKKDRNPGDKKEEDEAVKSIVSQLRNQDINGSVMQEKGCQRLTIGNAIANIEFMLPMSQAGPLVVPYLLYQNYCPS